MKPEQTSEELKAIAVKVFSDTLSEVQEKIINDFGRAINDSKILFKENPKLKPKYKYILSLNLDSFANEYELIKAKKSTKPKAYRDLIVSLYMEAQARYWKLFNKENETA